MGAVVTKKIPLSSGAGGLNTRDPSSLLKIDEYVEIVNYLTDTGGLAEKRPGKELVQYAPIDPQPFTAGPNYAHLWHFDTVTGDDVPDDTALPWLGLTLNDFVNSESVPGLFPIGAPLARKIHPAVDGSGFGAYGSQFRGAFGAGNPIIHGFTSVAFNAWIKINSTYSGKPVNVDVASNGQIFTYSNSGAHILATVGQLQFGGVANQGEARNGLTIYRDWDAVNLADGDPYIIFTLRTAGGNITTLRSRFLPVNKWLFIRGSYIQDTGKVRLRVAGDIHAEEITNGTVDDSLYGLPGHVQIGGSRINKLLPFFALVQNGFDGSIDECSIQTNLTEADEAAQPFKNPRGKPIPFSRSDGTQQLIVTAGDGLYYTVGDGNWTKMGGGFSDTAFWEGKQYGDIIYLTNGVDKPKSWDGTTLRPWGENVVAITLIENNTGAVAGLEVGSYEYYVTFLFGEKETGPGVASSVNVTVANNHVDIADIPIGPPNCTGRKIYRTKKNPVAGAKRFLLRLIPDNVTTMLNIAFVDSGDPDADTGRDGVPDGSVASNLHDDADYAEMAARVKNTSIGLPRFLAGNYSRLLACGYLDSPYTAKWCEIDSPDVWLGTSFVNAKADIGPLIAIGVYYNETHFSKNGKATLVLRGDQPANWQAFETLHPTQGAIDHWAYVHRVIPGSDTYRLAFMGVDGFYEYAGQDIYKISEKITPTFEGLTQADASLLQWITTTQAQFQAAYAAGGTGTTQNILQNNYETDGLRSVAGTMKLIDQYNFLGLWRDSNPLVPGVILFSTKGPAEGEFYFSTDQDQNIYRTTDNFATASVVPGSPVPAGHKVIEIVRKGATEEYFLITSGTGFTAGLGMHVYKFTHTGGGAGPWDAVHAVGNIFPRSDTLFIYGSRFGVANIATNVIDDNLGVIGATDGPIAANSTQTQFYAKDFYAIGNPAGASNASSKNVYLTHTQKPQFTNGLGTSRLTILPAADLTSLTYANVYRQQTGFMASINAGFYAFRDDASFGRLGAGGQYYWRWPTTGGYYVTFAHRENPFYSGGTFRPQAYWDTTNSLLVFVAGGLEDANGRVSTSVYKLTDGVPGVLTAVVTATSTMALANIGAGTAYVVQNSTSPTGIGTISKLYTLNLGTSVLTQVGAGTYNNIIPLRLAFNVNATGTRRLLIATKEFNEALQDSFSFAGSLVGVDTTSGVFTQLKKYAVGSITTPKTLPIEVAVQTETPYTYHVAMQNRDSTDSVYLAKVDRDAAAVTVNKTSGHNLATGMQSNLLFVPQSGVAGGYLWADRLYFFTLGASTNKLVQLGVAGTWRVVGIFESAKNNFGIFDSYDEFETQFSGTVNYDFRQAADIATLNAASWNTVAPNEKMLGFFPVQPYGQWRATLTWNSTVAVPDSSPAVELVNINYFFGQAQAPRICAEHFEGRTLFSVARASVDGNNLILCYQQNNSWTTFEAWNVKGMAIFRNQLYALEFYQLVKLMTGDTDMGNLIVARARKGYMMNDRKDKLMRTGDVNMDSFLNPKFPTKNGGIKVTIFKRGSATGNVWAAVIPSTDQIEPVQQKLRPLSGVFDRASWCREFSVQFETSQEASGAYMPAVNQREKIHSLMLRVWVTGDRYKNPTELEVPV